MTQYFVRFTDSANKVVTADTSGAGWFAVSEPSYEVSNVLNIGAVSTGVGAGKVEFLGLNLTLGASTLTEKIDAMLDAGKVFKTIELVGYDDSGAGLVKTSSVVFKTAAVGVDFIDITNGAHNLTFQYGGLIESTATINPATHLTEYVTAGWDRLKNAVDNDPAFDAHERKTDPFYSGPGGGAGFVPEAYPANRVFIQLRNLDGTPLSGLGTNWIEVDSASAAQLQALNLGSATGGAGAGKVEFDPLNIFLKSGSLAPLLDSALASGKAFQIELATYGDVGGGQDVLIDDYQFGLAGLSKSEFNGGSLSYAFEYGSERMAHNIYDMDGKFLATQLQGWDRVKNVSVTAPGGGSSSFDTQKAPAVLSDLTLAGPNLQAQTYYVRITDSKGASIKGDGGKTEWFEVSDVGYKLDQLLAIGTLSAGTGAGKVQFEDLHFTLGASALTQVIDHALKAGSTFTTIEIVGYGQNAKGPVKVSSTVFKTAGASGDSVDPLTGAHSFSFGYGGIVESVATFDNTGTPTGAVTAGWDRIKNIADNSVTFDATAHTGDPIAKGAPTSLVAPTNLGDHEVYLQIRNHDGSALAGLGDQWIKVDAAIFDDLQTLAIGVTPGSVGAGKVSFDALKLIFNPGTLSPVLDQAMAAGTPFQLELAVFRKSDTGSVLTDDFQFGLAGIKQHTFAEGQHTYSFAYGSERTLHNVFDATGAIGKPVIEGWDAVRNVSLTAPSGTDSSFDAQHAPKTTDALTEFTGGRGAMHYYVRFVGYDDKALTGDNGKAEWFEVSDPNYSGEQVLNLLAASSGVGAGKVTFNPLSFTLGSSVATDKLEQMLASGQPLKAIELVGYTFDNHTPVKVSETAFKLVGVKSGEVDVGSGAHKFSFEYGGLVESQATFDSFGQPNGAVTAGWDRIKNVADNSTTFDATETHGSDLFRNGKPVGTIGASDIGDHKVYLQIRNQDGSALHGLGAQWIAVDAALYSHLQDLNIGSSTVGVGAGKVTFEPMYLSFNPGALGPELSQALAQGKAFQIELAVYRTNPVDGSSALVDDYQFGLAGLSLHAVGGNSHFYEVGYGSTRVTHSVFDNGGTFVRTHVEGWDRVHNIALTQPSGSSSSFDDQHAPANGSTLSIFGLDPKVTIVSEDVSPGSSALFDGDTVTFTLNMSEAVFASGSYLQLSNGATAQFDPDQSSDTALVYTYTVATGDTAAPDLQATGLVGTIVSLAGHPLESGSFTAIDTGDAYIPNDPGGGNTPATIGGELSGQVAVGGAIDTVLGKLLVTDPDSGEAGIQALTLSGKFGDFAIDADGNWQYHLTNPAAAAAAKATGQPTTDSFNVLSIDGSASVDVVINAVVAAHPGALAFTGTANADTLYGAGDGDTLTGLGGNDFLYGLSGDDTLNGGPGNDLLNGSSGIDTASYADAGGSVKVSLGIKGPQDTGGGGIDTLVRIENLVGSAFADSLTGNTLVNHLFGGAGNDILNGGLGADIMEGGADSDSYRVDNAGDKVVEGLGGGIADAVRSSVTFTLSDNVENMALIGLNKIDGTGNALANQLFGNTLDNKLRGLGGKDRLDGDAGNDTLSGGADADILVGGAGKDAFVFDTAPIKGQQDRIMDFTLGEDKIQLSRSAFSAFAGHAFGQLTALDISFGTKATTETQHLIYNAAKGALYYDDDGSGSHAAILIGLLVGSPILAASDFALV